MRPCSACLLREQASLRLVVLSACEGAREAAREGVSSTAAKLVELGVPAVIGMEYPVSDGAAIEFSRVLYEGLVHGLPVDTAVAWARRTLYLGRSFDWITPIVFMRAPNGALFHFPARLLGCWRRSKVLTRFRVCRLVPMVAARVRRFRQPRARTAARPGIFVGRMGRRARDHQPLGGNTLGSDRASSRT
jgi:CHAT domain-containing protein